MDEALKERTRVVLAAACLPDDAHPRIDLYETGPGRIGGAVISTCFAGASPSSRQDRIWNKLDAALDVHERRLITFIITDTPEEFAEITRAHGAE